MSKEIKTIHELDLNLLREYFINFERQGPGSPEITQKALSFVDNLTDNSKIADIGCGTGGQTLELAKHTTGHITGIDWFSQYVEILNSNAKKLNLHERVNGIQGSMDDLQFQDESLDLIWSEGAIYIIGFERGLKEWRRFLKTGGYIAVSEASWFTLERPKEIDDFWMEAYPEIDLISNNVSKMEKAGYVPISTFILPEYCWIKNFYEPQVKVQEEFLKQNKGNIPAEELIKNQRHEMGLYYKYKAFYGYVFYIGKKI